MTNSPPSISSIPSIRSINEQPRPIFAQYPLLREALPHVQLADLPTPVQRLQNLEQAIGKNAPAIYIKRDDLSGPLYGGNKVRKLEFLLGRALHDKRTEVLTFGAAGSNHALATALYGRQLNLHCISMLLPQPNAHYVRRNLLMEHAAGAEMHHHSSMATTALATLWQLARHWLRVRQFPYLIAPGGSSPIGMLGFVNAGFELARQVTAGEMPEPDFIYAASGTMGTVVGLVLGTKAARLNTRLMAIRVTAPQFSSMKKAERLFRATNKLLHDADPSFPLIPFPASNFVFRHDFYGEEYARYTEEGMRAVHMLQETEGLKIEGTYTGKTLAALMADAKSGLLRGRTALFWNTHNSRDFNNEIADIDYHALPKAFHLYFEEDVQPLDK